MKKKAPKTLKLLAALIAGLASGGAYAADVFFDFDTDPTLGGSGFLFAGQHFSDGNVWCSHDPSGIATNGNPATGGYLSVTDGNLFNPGQGLVAVFPDIDAGLPVKAFHLTCDVRAGNSGNADGRPADGFSISYAREGDRVLINATNGTAGGAAGGDSDAETLSPLGSGDLENGTKSGVAICFDAWAGNRLPDTGGGNPPVPGGDVEGIEIRVDDKTLRQVDMSANRNGGCYSPTNNICGPAVCANPNTEQTGPWANDGGGLTDGTLLGLCWARLDVELTADKKVTVIWKGTTLVDHYQLTNYPNHRGRLVLMGRTGGNGQNAHFDNIHLTTVPAIEATLDHLGLGPNLNEFNFAISDNGASHCTNISTVILDGSNVLAQVTSSKAGGITTGIYHQTPFFAPNTTHSVTLVWRTDLNQTLSASNFTFTVPAYLILPPSLAVSSVDTTTPGFFVQAFQGYQGAPNRNYWADQQLEGLHGTNDVYFPGLPGGTNNEVVWEYFINFQNGAGTQFPTFYDWATFGIPATNASPPHVNDDNSAEAFCAYLYFPSNGIYYIGVNSDDGFRVSFNRNSHDMFGLNLPGVLSFDGGRGSSPNQNIGIVYISQPGYYGTRLLFYNGGGGNNVEFYTASSPLTSNTNNPILINDTNNSQAVLAYRVSTVAPPYVSFADPPLDDDEVGLVGRTLHYKLTDSASAANPGSVVLTVNGIVRAPTVNKVGGVTDISLPAPPALWPIGTNTVNLAYTDSLGSNYTYAYTFNVQAYVSLPTNLWTAVGSGRDPGFRIRAFQTPNTNIFNGWANNPRFAAQALNGLFGTNIADLTSYTNGGDFITPTVINYSQNGAGALTDNGDFRSTDTPAHPDETFPGLPGSSAPSMDNDCVGVNAFVEFPSAGPYFMGVNSDDGFRVTLGDRTSPGVSGLRILAPAGIAGEIVAMNTTQTDSDGNRGFGGALPTTPIYAQAVLCDPISADTPLVNASAIAGKIAVCQRTSANFATECANCFAAGAIAVVGGLAPGDVGQLPGTRGGTAVQITIPCVQISYEDGTNIIARGTSGASSPLYFRLSSEDCSLQLGQYSGGKGASDVNFAISVPVAGVYPLRLIWENGGGDANCEWFTMEGTGSNKMLINDPANPVKAWTRRIFSGGAHVNPPVVNGSNVTISWTGGGELEYAYSITGPWYKSANQNSPQTVSIASPPMPGTVFYRIRSF